MTPASRQFDRKSSRGEPTSPLEARPAKLPARRLPLAAFLVAALGLWGTGLHLPAWADSPPDARTLVRQLGSSQFDLRSEASRRLLELGPSSLDALQKAESDSDPEVRARSLRLIERVRTTHYESLLEDLLREPPRPLADRLPGWKKLVAITGDSLESRELYAAMLRIEPELLRLIDEDPEQLQLKLHERSTALESSLQFGYSGLESRMTTAEMAVLLLAAVSDSGPPGWTMPEFLLRPEPMPDSDRIGRAAELQPYRELLGAWVLTVDAGSRNNRFEVARRYRLPQVVAPAREIMSDPSESARQRQEAIYMVVRYGGVEHIPDLEPLLTDSTEISRRTEHNRETSRTQLQDVALAALLHLTFQNPRDYGLSSAPTRGTDFGGSSSAFGFPSQDERQSALRKWRVWCAVKLQSPLFGPLDAIAGTTL